MTPLLLSLLAIAVAPLLDAALSGRARASGFADGLVQVVVGGILLLHVLPFGLATAGWSALLALGAGAMVGVVAHRTPGGERSAGALAVLALLLHAAIDGAALGAGEEHEGHAGEGLLAWAVVLHTVPVGLATWRITRARAGTRAAAALLAATAGATAAGWWAAENVLHGASPGALGLAQCAVAGALLHVLGHVGEDSPRRTAGWGALAGALVVGVLTVEHPLPRTHPAELEAGRTLVTLLLDIAPALLVGYLVAGALHAFGPAAVGGWLGRPGRGSLSAALRGTFAGLVVPVCACGTLPTYRRILEAGAAPAAGLAFLVAGPEMGVGAVLVSLPLLGVELTAVRIGGAAVVALATGLVVARWARPDPLTGAPARARPRGAPFAAAERPGRFPERAREGLRFGLVEMVDHTAPWVLAGLGTAAVTEPLLATDALAGAPGPVVVAAAALLGVPAYVCASGVTPLVAVLLHKGLSTGAAVAFLLTGPATNLVALAALRRLHGPAAARAFGGTVTIAAVAIGLAVDRLLPGVAAPPLHAAAERPFEVPDGVAAAAIVVLFAASLVRNGAAGFLEPLLQPHGHDDDGHAHGGGHHGHAHGHGHAPHDHVPHDHDHTAHDHDHGTHHHDCAAHPPASGTVTLDIGAWKRR